LPGIRWWRREPNPAPSLKEGEERNESQSIEDKTAIAGIAWTKISRASGKSVMALAAEACLGAIEDAGLTVRDVDGFIEYQSNDSVGTMDVADVLGVPRINWYTDIRGGGNYGSASVMIAAMAVASVRARSAWSIERSMGAQASLRSRRADDTGPPRAVDAAVRYMVPPQWLAMWCRTHMAKYGTTYEHSGHRGYAAPQRDAEPARYLPEADDDGRLPRRAVDQRPVSPVRLHRRGGRRVRGRGDDCGASAVAAAQAGVHQGLAYGTQGRPSWEHWDDMSEMYARYIGQQLWQRTGLTAKDVDVAEIYDCFTYSLLGQLEGYGFCKTGEGGPFCASGRSASPVRFPRTRTGPALRGVHPRDEPQLRGGQPTSRRCRASAGQGRARRDGDRRRRPHGGALIYHTK